MVGDITFTFNGAYITQTLPDEATASSTTVTYWWEKETTSPDAGKLTGESGPLLVLPDSAVEGGS